MLGVSWLRTNLYDPGKPFREAWSLSGGKHIPNCLFGDNLIGRPRCVSSEAQLQRSSEPDGDGLESSCLSRREDGTAIAVLDKDGVKDDCLRKSPS